MLKIGNVKIENPLVLAPMADITTISFRRLCRDYGAGLVITEMVNANGVERGNQASIRIAKVIDEERPVAVQIFGQRASAIASAAQLFEKSADIIDFNCGCPVERVMRQGAGAALLKRYSKLKSIVEEASSTINKPFTVKIRSGLVKKDINAVKVAKLVEDAGAAAITIHARTQDQGYSGKADWKVIKDVADNVSIPVIGNGDVVDAVSCKKMLDETGCSFAMIGRAARGNPYLFRQCAHYLEKGELLPEQSPEEKFEDYSKLVKYAGLYKDIDATRLKRRAMDFTKGMKGSAELRLRLSRCRSVEEIMELLKR